jgi:formylmethanofuran dehydrogenase subunit E
MPDKDKKQPSDNYTQCSECGKPLDKSNESNDGGVCNDCYNSDSYKDK